MDIDLNTAGLPGHPQPDMSNEFEIFCRIVERANVLGWVKSPEGVCIYMSPAWYQFTGLPIDSGQGFGWLTAVHPDDQVEVRKAFFAATDAHEEYGVAYRLRIHTGEYKVVWGHGVPRRDSLGCFQGYFGTTNSACQFQFDGVRLGMGSTALPSPLTGREYEIINLFSQGHSSESIAHVLGISIRTVDGHARHIVEKLGARNRTHAVALALRYGYI